MGLAFMTPANADYHFINFDGRNISFPLKKPRDSAE